MKKRKYEKPLARNLSDLQPAEGSCYSGTGEQDLQGCQPTGAVAYECTDGGKVYPHIVCTPSGGFAGQSCISGSDAG